MNNFNPLLNEVFVFRPTDEPREGAVVISSGYQHYRQGLLRYASGEWIPDDGKPDLAFVHGVFAYGVNLPYSTNILWSWRDLELTRQYVSGELSRFYISGWHFQTINNTHWKDFRWDSHQRDSHPNTIAKKSAMDKCCSMHGCANGAGPELTLPNAWIERELLWIKSTMKLVKAPDNPICFLCLNNGKGHLLEALRSKKSSLESAIEYNWKAHQKAEKDVIDYKDSAEDAEERLKDIEQQIQALA